MARVSRHLSACPNSSRQHDRASQRISLPRLRTGALGSLRLSLRIKQDPERRRRRAVFRESGHLHDSAGQIAAPLGHPIDLGI